MHKDILKLTEIGLTENEAKTYYNLLKKDQFTATEIARLANVSRSKIYDVLENLIQKGLCIAKPEKVRKFSAESPQKAFDKIVEDHKSIIENINLLIDSLMPIYSNKKSCSLSNNVIQVFGTVNSIISKFDLMIRQSKKEVLSLCKPPYAMPGAMRDNLTEGQIQRSKEGVVYKSVYEVEVSNMDLFINRMKKYHNGDEEVRVNYNLPLKLHIFDNSKVLYSLSNNNNYYDNLGSDYIFVLMEHEDIVTALQSTFWTYWENSIPLDKFINITEQKEI